MWGWGVTCFLPLCRRRRWSYRILLTSSSTSKFSPWPCYPAPQCFLESWLTGKKSAHSFYSVDFILALTEIFSDFTSQVAIRKSVQHQHRHEHLRVSGSQKSGECCASDILEFSESAARHIIALITTVLLSAAEAACGGRFFSLTGPLFVCQTSLMKSSTGFVEGSTRPFVYNLLLLPGEVKAFNVRFTPISNHSVSSLLIVRYCQNSPSVWFQFGFLVVFVSLTDAKKIGNSSVGANWDPSERIKQQSFE